MCALLSYLNSLNGKFLKLTGCISEECIILLLKILIRGVSRSHFSQSLFGLVVLARYILVLNTMSCASPLI